jgi:hypothetical protein
MLMTVRTGWRCCPAKSRDMMERYHYGRSRCTGMICTCNMRCALAAVARRVGLDSCKCHMQGERTRTRERDRRACVTVRYGHIAKVTVHSARRAHVAKVTVRSATQVAWPCLIVTHLICSSRRIFSGPIGSPWLRAVPSPPSYYPSALTLTLNHKP